MSETITANLTVEGVTVTGTINTAARGAQGLPGVNGTDANVTQANIEAAITDKPGFLDEIGAVSGDGTGITDSAAFRSAIDAARTSAGGFVRNRPALMNTRWKLSALDHASPTTPHVGIMLLGDSIASLSYTVGIAAQTLMETFGIGAFFTPGLGNTWNGAAWTLGGGSTQAATDFTYLPGSQHLTIPSGGTASIVPGTQVPASAAVNNAQTTRNFWNQGSPKGVKTVSFFYITSPGAGSITCTLTQDGSTHTPVTVSTDAALGIGRVDFPLTDRHSAMTAAFSHSSGATVRALGVGFFFDKGVYFIDGATGGTSMDQQNAWISAPGVFADLVDELDIITVWHAQKIENVAENYSANYTALFNYLDTLGLDALIFGETPDGTDDAFTATLNAYLETQAHTRTYAYFDQWGALSSLSYLASRGGWNTDVTHLNGPAWRYLAGILMDELDNFRLAGQLTKQRPLIASSKISDEMEFLAIQGMRTQHIDGHAGRSFEGAATSGTGFATASNNQDGWRLTGGTAAGHAAGRLWASNIGQPFPNLAAHDLALCFSGYRNLNLLAGMTGWFVFGTQATVTDLAALPGKCFGVEFAVGSEVGSPGGITGPVCRIFAHNGITVQTGRWLRVDAAGDGGASSTGLTIGFVWRKADATLHMTKGTGGGASPAYRHSSLHVPDFLTGTLNGQWAGIGLRATGTPTSGSYFSISAASIMWQQDTFALPFPF
jgi:hypothetical protein